MIEIAAAALQQTYKLVLTEYSDACAEAPAHDDKARQAQRRHRLALLRLLASAARELSTLAKLAHPKPARQTRKPSAGMDHDADTVLTTGPVPAEIAEPENEVTGAVKPTAEIHMEVPQAHDTALETAPMAAPRYAQYSLADRRTVPDDALRASIPPEYWAWRPQSSLTMALQAVSLWRNNHMQIPGLPPFTEYAQGSC